MANPFSDTELQDKKVTLRFDKLVRQCAELILRYRNEGYTIHYLPFYRGSDEKFIHRVQQVLGTNDKVLQFGKDFSLGTINELFQQYSFGLCMRFHSILLAVKNSLPIVGIEYDFKSEMLLSEAGLAQFGVRYGIRKTDFFGELVDIPDDALLKIDAMVHAEKEMFVKKSKTFAVKQHNKVLDNYQKIFNVIGL